MRIRNESKCVGMYLHDYSIMQITDEYVQEVCGRCKNRVVIPVRNGKPYPLEYYKHHQRQAMQPSHPLYPHEYPQE